MVGAARLMRGLLGALMAPGRKDAVPLDQLPGFLMQGESGTGITVNWTTALQVTAMFACGRLIGQGLGQSRARLYRPTRNGLGSEVARDHPLHQLLYLEPSKGLPAFEFWLTIALHLLFVGNAFVFVNRVGSGRIHELLILDPGKVKVKRRSDLSLSYEVTGEEGGSRPVPAEAIWHIRGPSWNGWMGIETVRVAREALGLSLALEASHARMHKSGAQIPGVYSVEGELTDPQFVQLSNWLKRFAQGGDRAGTPLVLDRAAKWLTQQMSGVDQEHLSTRRYQVEEVCRAAGVMPIMLGVAEKTATYASAEQMFLAHEVHCIAPRASHLEQSAAVALLSDKEKAEGWQIKFNTSALRRGDYKTRQEGLQIQRRNGVINADEWRALEDMNPREDEGGPQYIVEANMALQDGRDLPPPKAESKPGEKDAR